MAAGPAKPALLTFVAQVRAADYQAVLVEWSDGSEGGPHQASRVALEDVADERSSRMAEAARAEALDQPREAFAEDRDARVHRLGERLVARGEIGRVPVRDGLAAEDVGVTPPGRDGDHGVGQLGQALEDADAQQRVAPEHAGERILRRAARELMGEFRRAVDAAAEEQSL